MPRLSFSESNSDFKAIVDFKVRVMSNQDAPKIEFPCAYPIKIVGRAAPDFKMLVLSVVEIHAPGIDQKTVTIQESSGGTFQSIRVTITATGEPQLQAMFEDLKATGRVQMVI
jgi:putative lipoic acid-binding regulatory protein